jgi:hypothetical protein
MANNARRLNEWVTAGNSNTLRTEIYQFSKYGAAIPKRIRETAERIIVATDVEEIAANAFNSWAKLREVVLHDKIKRIGNFAFANCPELTTINLPDSISYIASSAFYACPKLDNITLPNSLTEICSGTFDGCKNLTKIDIPSSITVISKDAFAGCDNLTIYCEQGSYAEQFAKDNNIDYNTSTTFAEDFELYENMWN